MSQAAAGAARDSGSVEGSLLRSRVYGLLAAVFRDVPDAGLVRSLREGGMLAVLGDMGYDLSDELKGDAVAVADALAVEYTRLFMGPGRHISPYASVRAGGPGAMLRGPEAAAVQAFCDAAGFRLHGRSGALPDHIAVELEVMQRLTEVEAAGATDVDRWRSLQGGFLSDHMIEWADGFFAEVADTAERLFYSAFAEIGRAFLHSEAEFLVQGQGAPSRSERSGEDDMTDQPASGAGNFARSSP